MNNGVLTFPSSRKSDTIVRIIEYVRDNKVLNIGYIELNDSYIKYLGLSDNSSSIDNSIEWLEFFKLVKQSPSNLERFYITEKGYDFFNYYIKNGTVDIDFIYHLLLDVTMPYKIGCTYKLSDKKYRVFETMFKVFMYLNSLDQKFDCRKFDEVYYFKLDDNNYKNYEEISNLILSTNEYTHQRPVIDYLFSVLELFNVLKKVDSFIYELNSDFEKLLMENMIMNIDNKKLSLPILSDPVSLDKIPFTSDFITYALREYLFSGKGMHTIDQEYYNKDSARGFLTKDVIDYYCINNNSNRGLYNNCNIKDVINLLNRQSDQRYIRLANALNNDESEDESMIELSNLDKFRQFCVDNIDYIKENTELIPKKLKEDFIKEYPLDKLKSMKLEEYSMGLDDDTTFCRKVESGKYRDYGVKCSGDPNGAIHWGIYYSKDKQAYIDYEYKAIKDPEEYWNKFKNELYDFLVNLSNDNPKFSDSYPMLKYMSKTLPKLCFMYYPDKFVNIIVKDRLHKLYKLFDLEYKSDTPADKLSYELNTFIRKNVEILKNENSEYISSIVWQFYESMQGNDINNSELVIVDDNNRVNGAYNKIYYGIPGSGKSYKVSKEFDNDNYKIYRTTFHPEYNNCDFIGQIIPVVKNNNVEYKFHPGAFTLALENALKNKNDSICLIIEEINRGNASAIFGDIFQLLDRDETGKSKYSIFNGPIIDYLKTRNINVDEIYIPSNMWIVATMNTSDQNVFTLDTAFKRRWKMEYIKNKFEDNLESSELRNKIIKDNSNYPNITWEKFIKKINDHIIHDTSGINGEDKQLGVYFVTIEEIENEKEFAEKILSYLWEDVARINPSYWFGSISSYDELIELYDTNYLDVFNSLFDEDKVIEEHVIKTIGE